MTNLIPQITSPEIERAEKVALAAQQAAADLKLAVAAHDERLRHLSARRAVIAVRLDKLIKRDVDAARLFYTNIVGELLDSRAVEVEHARKLELANAVTCLSDLRELELLLPGIIATVKSELAQADAELTALESEK